MNYINRHSLADIVGNDRTRKYISQVLFYICLAVYMTASLLQYTSIKSGYPDFNIMQKARRHTLLCSDRL